MTQEKSNWNIAYSYIRFSALAQEKGDSVRRQSEGYDKYVAANTLTPAKLTLRDLGVSAFRGKNQHKGALAVFLRAIREGHVKPGSVLVVENLDRLSRQEPLDSIDIVRDIVNAGVKIVTLTDGQEYTRESISKNPAQLFILLAVFMRAHEESKTKSERVSAAWCQKRKTPEKKLTGRCPGWLTLDKEANEFRFNEHAETVRRIIALALEGRGPAAIATRLNRDKVPTLLNAAHWHFSTVRYLLTSRTLIGEFQPCQCQEGRHVPQGSPIKGYYPTICDEGDFYKIANFLASRKRFARGRTGNSVANLFGRLLVSGHDGSTMIFRLRHGKGPSLTSIKTNTGATHHPSFPYKPFEFHFLKWVAEVRLGQHDEHPSKMPELEGKVEEKLRQREKAQAMALAANGQTFDGLLELVRELDVQIAQLRQEIEWERAREHKPTTGTADLADLIASLRDTPEGSASLPEVRDRIRSAIGQVVQKIKLYTFRRGMMLLAVVHVLLRDGLNRVFELRVERGKQPVSWSTGVAFSYGEYELDGVAVGEELVKHKTWEEMHRASTAAQYKAMRRVPGKPVVPAAITAFGPHLEDLIFKVATA